MANEQAPTGPLTIQQAVERWKREVELANLRLQAAISGVDLGTTPSPVQTPPPEVAPASVPDYNSIVGVTESLHSGTNSFTPTEG